MRAYQVFYHNSFLGVIYAGTCWEAIDKVAVLHEEFERKYLWAKPVIPSYHPKKSNRNKKSHHA